MKKQKLNSKMPLVSVIVPVFNGAQFLEDAVLSIQKNTYSNYEVLLVDDGSTDTSKDVCKKLASTYCNVRFYSFPKNRGMDHALNLALRKAKGKYIARLNQDDLMEPDRLQKQVKFLGNHPDYVAVGGAISLFNNEGKTIAKINFPLTDKAIKSQWLFLSPYADPTVMYRKSAWVKAGGYDQRFWPADDVHLWYRLGKLGKLANLNCILTKVRWFNGVGSIKLHRLQIIKTSQAHVWADKHVEKAKLKHWLFWSLQLMGCLILPPQFNWYVYRFLRKIQKNRRQYLLKLKTSLAKPIFPASRKGTFLPTWGFVVPRR